MTTDMTTNVTQSRAVTRKSMLSRSRVTEKSDGDADCHADQHDATTVGDDHAAHLADPGAQRHTDSDFPCALRHHIRQRSVNSHRAQEQRQSRGDCQREHRKGKLGHRARREAGHREDTVHGRARRHTPG